MSAGAAVLALCLLANAVLGLGLPDRPAMPTKLLLPWTSLWLLRAALVEIDRREGYEPQLRDALTACAVRDAQVN